MIKISKELPWKSKDTLDLETVTSFKKIINNPEYGFYHAPFKDFLSESKAVKNSIKRKIKTFVHIGLGGSSLGPEAMISALKKNDTSFIFLNNVDAFQVQDSLSKVELNESLFYIVSKSGTTAETISLFSVVTNFLLAKGIAEKDFSEYLVFCTDPERGDLRGYAKKNNIACLDVPVNIGGRFSIFTSVGFFPALFADINIEKLIQGIEDFKKEFEAQDFQNHWTLITQDLIDSYHNQKIDQTVMMPYSYQLKDLSLWFVQLWAESLGKDNKGLTPLSAYGASDQHSQVQLFMEGPNNKNIFFLELSKIHEDFDLSSPIALPSLAKMKNLSMSTLMTAELRGTELALKEQERPYYTIKLPEVNEESFGQLLFYFQCLTVMVGISLKINPFDQPGVEAGKKFAWEWIRNHQKG